MSISRRFAVLLAIAALSGCADQQRITDSRTAPPDLTAYVTPELAAHLDGKGRFSIDNAPPQTGPATIDAARAAELAAAFVRTFGPLERTWWENEHGGPIDLASLRVDPRIFLAHSPYGPLPEGRYHPAHARAYGPFYMVTMLSGGAPVLRVAVSAYNADVAIEKGKVVLPMYGGNDFLATGIPADTSRGQPNTPESAVARVGRRFGVRTTQAPAFVIRSHAWQPQASLWRVDLEREIPLRGKERSFHARTREVYVGLSESLFIPAARQPSSERARFMTGPPYPGPVVEVDVPIRAGAVVEYEEVIPDVEGS